MLSRLRCGSMCYALLWAAAACLATVHASNPLVPANGAWVGVSIDWQEWASVNDYVQQAEFQPTSYTVFVRYGCMLQAQCEAHFCMGCLHIAYPLIARQCACSLQLTCKSDCKQPSSRTIYAVQQVHTRLSVCTFLLLLGNGIWHTIRTWHVQQCRLASLTHCIAMSCIV